MDNETKKEIDMSDTCDMVIIEASNFDILWECSECKTEHKATKKFEKNKACPECGKEIANWVGMDDEYADA